uniref:Uncharacterized protein n=1 Tax=viral metagenome TaxID=1070528 RepID=A0A6C0BM73_9ZZZZ
MYTIQMGHDCDFYIIHKTRSSRLYECHYYISFNFSTFSNQYGWHMDTLYKQL